MRFTYDPITGDRKKLNKALNIPLSCDFGRIASEATARNEREVAESAGASLDKPSIIPGDTQSLSQHAKTSLTQKTYKSLSLLRLFHKTQKYLSLKGHTNLSHSYVMVLHKSLPHTCLY